MASPEHTTVNSEAKAHKTRNQGSMNSWLFSGYDDTSYESPRPKQRINTKEAAEFSKRNEGSLREVMSMTPRDDDKAECTSPESPKRDTPRKTGPPAQRCPTEESRRNMDRHRGNGMKGVFDMDNGNGTEGRQTSNGDHTPDSPSKTRTRPEAQANKNKNKGSMNIGFGENATNGQTPNRRVKPEGSQYAERNKGSLTQQMRDYGSGERTPPPARRIKGDARANAAMAGGTGIMDVFHHKGEN